MVPGRPAIRAHGIPLEAFVSCTTPKATHARSMSVSSVSPVSVPMSPATPNPKPKTPTWSPRGSNPSIARRKRGAWCQQARLLEVRLVNHIVSKVGNWPQPAQARVPLAHEFRRRLVAGCEDQRQSQGEACPRFRKRVCLVCLESRRTLWACMQDGEGGQASSGAAACGRPWWRPQRCLCDGRSSGALGSRGPERPREKKGPLLQAKAADGLEVVAASLPG